MRRDVTLLLLLLFADVAEMPTKCVSTVATIGGVEAQLVFIDFEGRTDGMSLKILLSQIKPRQLVSAQWSVAGQSVVSRWSVVGRLLISQ